MIFPGGHKFTFKGKNAERLAAQLEEEIGHFGCVRKGPEVYLKRDVQLVTAEHARILANREKLLSGA